MIDLKYKYEEFDNNDIDPAKNDYPYRVFLTEELLPLIKSVLKESKYENWSAYYRSLERYPNKTSPNFNCILTEQEFCELLQIVEKYNSDLLFKEKFDNFIKE